MKRLAPLLIAALAFPASAEAATFNGRVATVVDGDTVRVKTGARTRTVNLAGVAAPTGSECFAPEAKSGLGRLLRKGAAVRVRTVGRAGEVFRGRTNVNRALVKGGFARAKPGGGARGATLRRDQAAAREARRGLHGRCTVGPPGPGAPGTPAPTGPGDGGGTTTPPAAPGDVTGQAAIDQMKTELRDARFRVFKSGSGTFDSFALHLCADDNWRYFEERTTTSGDASFNARTEHIGRPWQVTEAIIKADGSRSAKLKGTVQSTADNTGPQPVQQQEIESIVEFVNGQWFWEGQAAEATGAADCNPVLNH